MRWEENSKLTKEPGFSGGSAMTSILRVNGAQSRLYVCVQVSATLCEFGKVTFSNLRGSIARVYFHPKFWIMPPLIEILLNDILAPKKEKKRKKRQRISHEIEH